MTRPIGPLRRAAAPLAWAVATTLAFVSGSAPTQAHGQPIVGSWRMEVLPVPGVTPSGAPYSPHLMQFHREGTVLMTNPTNVQERNGQGTTDSVGMGAWAARQGQARFTVVQRNATQPADTPAPDLTLTFTCTVNGDRFRCTGNARIAGQYIPAILTGQRITA